MSIVTQVKLNKSLTIQYEHIFDQNQNQNIFDQNQNIYDQYQKIFDQYQKIFDQYQKIFDHSPYIVFTKAQRRRIFPEHRVRA